MKTASSIETEIQTLESFSQHGREDPILSLYLVTDTSLALGRDIHAQCSTIIADLRASLEPEQHRLLGVEVGRVNGYLGERAPENRSVAIFTSQPLNMFTVVPLPVRVATGAFWGTEPYLRPLRSVLDEFEPTLVVLVDQQRARLFRMFLDQVQELSDVESWVRRHTRQAGGAWAGRGTSWLGGGWGDTHAQDRHKERVHHHIRRVIDAAQGAIAERPVGRIIVGGTPEAVAALRQLAPRPIASRIGAEVSADLRASVEDVRAQAGIAIEALERAAETQQIAEMVEKQGSGMASFGTESVLDAINAENVYVLVYLADLELSGRICGTCGRLAAARGNVSEASCSGCSGATAHVPDLVDAMVARVLALGGRTEEVRGEAADALTSLGGLGVKHRYPALTS
jgi:peptide subunit release factor 1 (eRF1)